MSIGFWLKRFCGALAVAFGLLLVAQWLRGAGLAQAAIHAVLWGLLTAAVYTAVGYIKYRRNPACMVRQPRDGR